MKQQITFTLDLEDHRPNSTGEKRYPQVTQKILSFWDAHNIKATVFTVGMLAQEAPELVQEIHKAGHEIACHSWDHTVLTQQSPEDFRDHTRRAKQTLEDIISAPVTGYRAPVFSLTQKTLWAPDILQDLGFEYSSSVLPAGNPLHGFPGAPPAPFRWPCGLLEIPAPIGKIGPLTMPYLGGFYFRYLPLSIIKSCAQKAQQNTALWTYCHPYDFDHGEKNWRIKNASPWISLLLWLNRKNTFRKMESLAQYFDFTAPFKDQTNSKNIPVFQP